MIPAHLILSTTLQRGGLSGSLETITVRHVSGGTSVIGLKTYEQGRSSFEGTSRHVIWCDEEPPEDCYTEMLYRTVTTRGIVLTTFTPLQGLSSVVKAFLEPTEAARAVKWHIQAGWDDVPHLDPEEKAAVLAATPPWQRDARTKGTPSLGAGAIYPIPESEFVVSPFEIPEAWPRVYGLDVGWNRTAAIWGAIERATKEAQGTLYLYTEHYRAEAEPAVHAAAIRGRGAWVPGVIDPAARGRAQKDGHALLDVYKGLGLDLEPANHAVDAGLYAVWALLSAGRLKVLSTCQAWLREYRMYRRDEAGKIVKQDDHLMDATRYLVMSGRERAKTAPAPRDEPQVLVYDQGSLGTGWMG
jgi:phage terminase large subunit-like protein